jgi:ribonuclease HI
MDDLCTLSSRNSGPGVDGLACPLFEFGLSADVAKVVGATEFSLSGVVSHRGTYLASRHCLSMHCDDDAAHRPRTRSCGPCLGYFAVGQPADLRNGITEPQGIRGMRVFTDGACSNNGRPGAKAGYAIWFPDHTSLSESARLPSTQPQTNQRAELSAIARAVEILDEKGFYDVDIVLYTDSDYSMNCLTKWLPGWISRGWKTSSGTDVLHRDLIEETSRRLSKFKSHRFVHVRAHTGGIDDLSKNNDVVDRMARGTIDETVRETPVAAVDVLFEGCPLQLMGAPIAQTAILTWIKSNISTLDQSVIDKHLYKAFVELCKNKDVALTKQTIQKTPVVRAERMNLQITHTEIEKEE